MKRNTDIVVMICSNYAWTIYNFRMPLIRALKKSGYRVEVITEFDGYETKISHEVDHIHSLFIARKGINPLVDLTTFLHLFIVLLKVNPTLLLSF